MHAACPIRFVRDIVKRVSATPLTLVVVRVCAIHICLVGCVSTREWSTNALSTGQSNSIVIAGMFESHYTVAFRSRLALQEPRMRCMIRRGLHLGVQQDEGVRGLQDRVTDPLLFDIFFFDSWDLECVQRGTCTPDKYYSYLQEKRKRRRGKRAREKDWWVVTSFLLCFVQSLGTW
ncbi:hypothetical protein BC629DRAFT_1541253 [Irpex lacteus]|nr:hypothetical protein BC629DRAFT_1541253 [Irpex lacteus]